ncbi:MAG: site-specific DNA-methyltransferase [Candidatus Lokiarchaeota archaeon]|nr:site-specific DNA-methyltransferase [Candidatus Lokiarchaeota archaeon]
MDTLEIEGQAVYFGSSEHMDAVESGSVTLVVTSPPYWNVRDYGGDQIGFGQSYKEYVDALNKVWLECLRVLQPNGKIAINLQPLPIPSEQSGFGFRVICDIMHDVQAFFRDHDCFLSGMAFWNKAAYVNNVSWGSYPKPTNIATNTSFEQIYTFVKRGETRKISKEILDQNLLSKEEWRHWAVRCVWDDIQPVIKINPKGENIYGHGAPFPEDIPYRLIRMHTVEGETVLDPFAGSGTTLKVARLTRRKGIGFEINAGYREKIRARIMEPWTPPPIDEGYITLGYKTLRHVIDANLEIARSLGLKGVDEGKYVDMVLARLLGDKILSPAVRDRLKSARVVAPKRNPPSLDTFIDKGEP